MISVKNIETFNFKNAVIGMRNAFESWSKSDSFLCKGVLFDDCKSNCDECPRCDESFDYDIYCIGKDDLYLMHKLINGGSPHDKFMRQILCSMQITAPLYWWKEFDTYKVATVANSTSTMHMLHKRPILFSDFSFDNDLKGEDLEIAQNTIKNLLGYLNELREKYIETKDLYERDNPYWRMLIQLLPDSYNQMRMWTGNYLTLREMYKWRKRHRLSEWVEFSEIIKNNCPYGKELIAYGLD